MKSSVLSAGVPLLLMTNVPPTKLIRLVEPAVEPAAVIKKLPSRSESFTPRVSTATETGVSSGVVSTSSSSHHGNSGE